jgi:hypothetical protein
LIQNYNAMIYLSKLFLFILDYIIYDIILVKKTRKVEKNHIIYDTINHIMDQKRCLRYSKHSIPHPGLHSYHPELL